MRRVRKTPQPDLAFPRSSCGVRPRAPPPGGATRGSEEAHRDAVWCWGPHCRSVQSSFTLPSCGR